MAQQFPPGAMEHILKTYGAQLAEVQLKIDDLDNPEWVEKWRAKQRNKLSAKRSDLEAYIAVMSATHAMAQNWEEHAKQLDLPLYDEETGEVRQSAARVARKFRDEVSRMDGIDSVTFSAAGKSVRLEGRRRSAEPEKMPAAG